MSCNVVHCIDAEGPLHESVEATFPRVRDIFGIDLEPSRDNLARLHLGDIAGVSDDARLVIRTMLAPEHLAFNDSWDKVDAAVTELLSDNCRKRLRVSQEIGSFRIFRGSPRAIDEGQLTESC